MTFTRGKGVKQTHHSPEPKKVSSLLLTGSRWMTELLEVTVCSPSCIMAISPLSSEASARLFTELLWLLALMDMLGTDWLLSMLVMVPVQWRNCSDSWQRGKEKKKKEGVTPLHAGF